MKTKMQCVLDIHHFTHQLAAGSSHCCRAGDLLFNAYELCVNNDHSNINNDHNEVIRVYIISNDLCYLEHYGDVYLFNSCELSNYLVNNTIAD